MTAATQFNWQRHNQEQAQRMADLLESIDRWRAAAEAFGNQRVLYAAPQPERENV